MERIIVYQILDGERDYQDDKWTESNALNGIPDKDKSVSEWIGFMEYHINKAKNCVYNIDQQGALAEIRKITALGVKVMESLGCPERKGYERTLDYWKSTSHPRKIVYKIPVEDIPVEDIQAYLKRVSEQFKNNYSATLEGELIIPNGDITITEKNCDCGDTQHDCNGKD